MTLLLRLFSYLKIVKWQFSLGTLLLGISTLCMQFSPIIIQNMIDNIITPVSQGAVLDTSALIQYSVLFLTLVIVSGISGYIALRILMYCANAIGEYMRNEAYDVMQKLPVAYFDDKPAGKISTRIINDTETLRYQFYGNVITLLFFNTLIIISIYVIMFTLNAWLGSVLLLLLPFIYLWQKIYTKQTKKSLEVYYETQSLINTHINETMNGSTILQLFKQEERMAKEFDTITFDMYKAQQRLVVMESGFSWTLIDVFKRTVIVAILAITGYQIIGGHIGISTGLLFSSLNYTERLFNTVGAIIRTFPGIQRAMTTGRRVFELLDADIEEDSEKQLVITKGEVTFKDVVFGYTPNQTVLKHINITAKQGEVVALVGHTGSGKSSIINLLFRFYDPRSGIIEIDGQNIKDYNRESIRKDMGIVLQDPYLFTGTIASNVTMDDDTITREDVTQALIDVGAEFMLQKFTNGIDEKVVEKGNTFSSGERQLISFARTLASDPKILILDEATSHIDTETENIIQNAMKVVQQGRTTFIIAHRLSTIQHADQILVLHEGEIVERGNHQSLLQQNGRYAEMYRMQANGKE